MGWDYWASSQAELVAELTRSSERFLLLGGPVVTREDGTAVLWFGGELRGAALRDGAPTRLVGCSLLDTTRHGARVLWGSKDMDETVGPYYYTCPAGLLEVTDGPWWSTVGLEASRWRRAMMLGAGKSRAAKRAHHEELTLAECEWARAAAEARRARGVR